MYEQFKTKNLHFARFALNKGSILPLHDHPQREGIIYLLKGKCRVQQYTLVERKGVHVLLQKTHDDIILPHDVQFFLSDLGNIHSLEAIEDSVIMDVFSPPFPEEAITSYFEIINQEQGDNIFKARIIDARHILLPKEFS